MDAYFKLKFVEEIFGYICIAIALIVIWILWSRNN